MKGAYVILGLSATCLSLLVSSCSLAVWVRVFNTTDHTIELRSGAYQQTVVVPPGKSGRVAWASFERDRNFSFVVKDSGVERFYAVVRRSDDGSTQAASLIFPKEARRPKQIAPEYFVEYPGDGTIFMLDAAQEESPHRLDPQPVGFPIRPTTSQSSPSPAAAVADPSKVPASARSNS
jgi:hypothetical protein